MSTSFLQHLLVKQHIDRGDDSESAGSSADRDSLADLSASASALPLVAPSKDYCVSVAQLLHYIHGLVVSSNW